jgi:hypothetical protein
MKHGEIIAIKEIRLDGGTQPRATIDFEAVFDYMDAMADGAKFPPVVVFYDGASYWLADGFHRVKAAEQAGTNEIACDLHQGTQQDAQWYSFGANKTNGLRRTNDDKHRAVKAALGHPNGAQLSNRQIAIHVGVDEGTVRNWREKLTAEIPQSPKRKGRDGRTIKVTNIGKTASQPIPAAGPEAVQPAEPIAATCATHLSPSTECVGTNADSCGDAAEGVANYWCQRVWSAASDIAECPVSAKDLAAALRRSNNNQLTKQLEKTRDFIAAVLAEAGID